MPASTPIATRPRRVLDGVLLALFLVGISAPTLDQIVRPAEVRGPAPELRVAAEQPLTPRTQRDIATFPSRFEAFYKDFFGLRDKLLRWNSLVKHYGFGVGSSANLVPSSSHWICYAGDRTLDVLRGIMPFSHRELEGWKRRLEGRRDALAKHGIRYLFVMIPNKETVYSERLPPAINRVGPSRLEQLAEHLAATSDVRIVDLRPAFERAKVHDREGEYLYNPLGTHWSARGSETAYLEIMRAVSEQVPNAQALRRGEYRYVDSDENRDTWATSMYVRDVLRQREQSFYPNDALIPDVLESISALPMHQVVGRRDAEGPRVLVYHDSFLSCIEGVFAASFPRLETVWANSFSMRDVERGRPDIVLEMFVERALVNQLAFVDPPEDIAFRALESTPGWARKSLLGGAGTVADEMFEGRSARLAPGASQDGITTVWFNAVPSASVMFSVTVECDVDELLVFYWRSAPAEAFSRRHRLSVPIRAGRHEYTARTEWSEAARGQVLVRKRTPGSDLRLESVEISTLVKSP